MAPPKPPFVHPLRVRFSECDMQGHVFNAHYLTYFDLAHTELLREAIGSYQRLVAGGQDLVVAAAQARYRAPARFDDELEIEMSVTRLGTTGMGSGFRMARGEQTLAEVDLRHVFVTAADGTKTPIPDAVRAGLAPYVADAAALGSAD